MKEEAVTERRPVSLLTAAALLFSLLLPGAPPSAESPWTKLDEGLFLGEFASPRKSIRGDSVITVLKLDPGNFSLVLLSASELGGSRMNIGEWAKKYGLVAAVNAGMYQADGISNVGYMRNFNHVNNGHLNKYQAVLAFNPVDGSPPEVQIIDRQCQDFGSLKDKYSTLVQNIRMISCRQVNVWASQEEMWSIASLGIDTSGNVLFIFSESPYTVHDFIDILLGLPLSIHNAMYLEGGTEAALYLSTGSFTLEKSGSGMLGAPSPAGNPSTRLLPNIIGVVKKRP